MKVVTLKFSQKDAQSFATWLFLTKSGTTLLSFNKENFLDESDVIVMIGTENEDQYNNIVKDYRKHITKTENV